MYDHLMSTRIFTLIMNKIFNWVLEMKRQTVLGSNKICSSSCTNYMSHILHDVDIERILSIFVTFNTLIEQFCSWWMLIWPQDCDPWSMSIYQRHPLYSFMLLQRISTKFYISSYMEVNATNFVLEKIHVSGRNGSHCQTWSSYMWVYYVKWFCHRPNDASKIYIALQDL